MTDGEHWLIDEIPADIVGTTNVVASLLDARLSAARHLLEICAPDGNHTDKLHDAIGWLKAADACATHMGDHR